MADIEALKRKVQELEERDWDVPGLEARIKKLAEEGIPRKTLNRDEMLANKQQIRDRVQQRSEEYNFLFILARKEKRNENQDIFCTTSTHHHCFTAFWLFRFNQARSALEPND